MSGRGWISQTTAKIVPEQNPQTRPQIKLGSWQKLAEQIASNTCRNNEQNYKSYHKQEPHTNNIPCMQIHGAYRRFMFSANELSMPTKSVSHVEHPETEQGPKTWTTPKRTCHSSEPLLCFDSHQVVLFEHPATIARWTSENTDNTQTHAINPARRFPYNECRQT